MMGNVAAVFLFKVEVATQGTSLDGPMRSRENIFSAQCQAIAISPSVSFEPKLFLFSKDPGPCQDFTRKPKGSNNPPKPHVSGSTDSGL